MKICIEGPDGSGKTTVAKMLAEHLKVPYARCPGFTTLGEHVRPILKDSRQMNARVRAMLFATVDYDAHASVADDVVLDRCGISGIIYRLAANEPQQVALLKHLFYVDQLFLLPDDCLVIRLDAANECLDQRMGLRGNETDEGSFFKNEVRRIYRSMPESVQCLDTTYNTPIQLVEKILCLRAVFGPNPWPIMNWAMNIEQISR